MLKLAEIDTEIFKAHSIRSASASAAASGGLTTNQIMIGAQSPFSKDFTTDQYNLTKLE